MPTPVITWERQLGGYIAWNGPYKIAVLGTTDDRGLVRNGAVVREPAPLESWGLHFTSPSMPVALLKALLASLPTEA